MLFIVIHQVYELWFKLVLHETDKLNREFAASDLFGAIATVCVALAAIAAMAKSKTIYVCTECGGQSPKWRARRRASTSGMRWR